MLKNINTDRIIGIALLVFSILTYTLLPNFINIIQEQEFGAEFFPKVILIVLMILSVALIIKSFLHTKEENSESSKQFEEDRKKWVGWSVFGLLILYSFIVEKIGFIISSIIIMSIILFLLSARKWYYYLILIVMIFLIYYIFVDLMRIMLP